MENFYLPSKTYRDSFALGSPLSKRVSLKQHSTCIIDSIKKIGALKLAKRQSNIKENLPLSNSNRKQQYDLIKEADAQEVEIKQINFRKTKLKGVRFKDRISIQNRQSMLFKSNSPLNDITNEEKIQMLNNFIKQKNFNLPMTSRRRANDFIKIVLSLLNSPIQSKSTVINELKCFMCHYPDQNSILFGKKTIASTKEKLLQADKVKQSEVFFRYDGFGQFLKTLYQLNYDSHQLITSYQGLIGKYQYPTSIKLMLYYLGMYLYQLNNMYDRAQAILKMLKDEIFKFKLYEYIGIYLLLMIKIKGNLLQWESCVNYLMKLLAYSWLYKFQNLQIWVYFQLARSYCFLNYGQESQYFNRRSEMSVVEPSSIYREMISRQFKKQIEFMREEHKYFDFTRKITIYELVKLPDRSEQVQSKESDTFKIQSQIKNINEHCKIRHVKNLLTRMNIHATIEQGSQSQRGNCSPTNPSSPSNADSNVGSPSLSKLSLNSFAGNPLFRTHESGLKNLNVYFRSNTKREHKSYISKNRQPKLYTFQNSGKNMLVIKQICRNILLEMKWCTPINVNGGNTFGQI